MKIGIIAEFNPLHTGHIHLMHSVKKQHPTAQIFIIMSTYLTQRGELSFVSPQKKVMLALQNGADFIFELPSVFSSQRADLFAFGAIDICKKLKLDAIAFGVENIDFFHHLETIEEYQGIANTPYLSKINMFNDHLSQSPFWQSSPNNILAYFYQKASSTHYPELRFIPIQRIGANYSDKNLTTEIASATALRTAITSSKSGEIEKFIPYQVEELFPYVTWEKLYPFFLQTLLITDDLTSIATIGKSGLAQRMKKAAHCLTFEAFTKTVKTKAYTSTSIQRAMLFTLLHISQAELDMFCNYALSTPPRLLGVKKELTSHLKKISYFTSYSQIQNPEYRKTLEKIEAIFFSQYPNKSNQHFPFIYEKNMS